MRKVRKAAEQPRLWRVWRLGAAALSCLVLANCAIICPTVSIERRNGEEDTGLDERVRHAPKNLGPNSVKILPLNSPPLDANLYELVAFADISYDNNRSLRDIFWIQDYEDPQLFGFCTWQIPFKIVTIGLWNLLPWSWPCMSQEPARLPEKERMRYLHRYARYAALQLQADTVTVVDHFDAALANTNTQGVMAMQQVGTVGIAQSGGYSTTYVQPVRFIGIRYVFYRLKGTPLPAEPTAKPSTETTAEPAAAAPH